MTGTPNKSLNERARTTIFTLESGDFFSVGRALERAIGKFQG
jgi:hypothetical protein